MSLTYTQWISILDDLGWDFVSLSPSLISNMHGLIFKLLLTCGVIYFCFFPTHVAFLHL